MEERFSETSLPLGLNQHWTVVSEVNWRWRDKLVQIHTIAEWSSMPNTCWESLVSLRYVKNIQLCRRQNQLILPSFLPLLPMLTDKNMSLYYQTENPSEMY